MKQFRDDRFNVLDSTFSDNGKPCSTYYSTYSESVLHKAYQGRPENSHSGTPIGKIEVKIRVTGVTSLRLTVGVPSISKRCIYPDRRSANAAP